MHWDRSMQSFAPHFGSEHCRTHGDQLWRAKKTKQKTKIDINISVMWKQHTGFILHALLCSQLTTLYSPSTQNPDFISFFILYLYLWKSQGHTHQAYDGLGFFPSN